MGCAWSIGALDLEGDNGEDTVQGKTVDSPSPMRVLRDDGWYEYWWVSDHTLTQKWISSIHVDHAIPIHSLIALLLGRLRLSIDDAIITYNHFTKKIFSTTQIGGDGKYNAETFENTIKEIIRKVTTNPQEQMLDNRSNACKV